MANFDGAIRRYSPSILRTVFLLLQLLVLLFFGSVEKVPLHVVSTLFFSVALLSILTISPQPQSRSAFNICILVLALLVSWVLLQNLRILGNSLAHPFWQNTVGMFGGRPVSISVAPGDSLAGLVSATLPFIVFAAALLLFKSDEFALYLLRGIVWIGFAATLFGLVQFLLFPGTVLFATKFDYLDSLTGWFINRNTAATHIAINLLLALGLAFHHVQAAGPAETFKRLTGADSIARRSDVNAAIRYAAMFAVMLVALMLTKSRGGVVAGGAGILVFAMLLSFFGGYRTIARSREGFGSQQQGIAHRLARAGLVMIAFLCVGAVVAGRALLRIEIQGAEDGRFCIMPGLFRLFSENWIVGTGLSTFHQIFPAYRDPSCGILGGWERAHNFYIEGWISLGLAFPLLLVIIVSTAMMILVRGIKTRKKMRWVPMLGLSAMITVLLHSAIDFSIQIPAVAVTFAAILAGCSTISANKA